MKNDCPRTQLRTPHIFDELVVPAAESCFRQNSIYMLRTVEFLGFESFALLVHLCLRHAYERWELTGRYRTNTCSMQHGARPSRFRVNAARSSVAVTLRTFFLSQ